MNKTTNAIVTTALALQMIACTNIKDSYNMVAGPNDDATPQEIFCHNEAIKDKPSEIGTDAAIGAGVGAAAGGVKTIVDSKSSAVTDILSGAGIGAGLGALYGTATKGNKYAATFKECMDYTKQHPEQWENAVPAPERAFDR